MTSSDAALEPGAAGEIHLAHSVVDLVDPPSSMSLSKESGLDRVLASILNGREMDPTTMAEQEQLNPTDSITRIPVPVLDFRSSKPSWMDKNWEARGHFVWLQASSPETYQFPLLPIDRRLNRSLRWTPFPAESTASLMAEEVDLPRESQSILKVDKTRHPGSVRYVLLPQIMAILDMGEDMELQEIPAEGLAGLGEAATRSESVVSKMDDEAALRTAARDQEIEGGEGLTESHAAMASLALLWLPLILAASNSEFYDPGAPPAPRYQAGSVHRIRYRTNYKAYNIALWQQFDNPPRGELGPIVFPGISIAAAAAAIAILAALLLFLRYRSRKKRELQELRTARESYPGYGGVPKTEQPPRDSPPPSELPATTASELGAG
ncbi:hypothetical protein CDD80_3561 [Ophiocordyceps camponoti-rufipedis]|uniref:Uncharacterized protein n=1 Tax=Ophiocordyceps camponoti-rufipedis TaxID=2004952 RepID=A0A2C5Z342_9HYPO|nr:hypothetical protein CDD80_3561 [Ophiocordyceps camponoti-rufipedis]